MRARARALAKRLAERALVAAGAPRILRSLRRSDAVILAYHNVVPHGELPGGDRSLHLSQADFAHQLDLLMESHDVVELEAVLRDGDGGAGRPRAAVTLDDAYRGALTAGRKELSARGLPYTVFVAPDLLGSDALWWDALAPGGGPLSEALREELLTRANGRSEDVWYMADRRGFSRKRQPGHAGIVDEAELRAVAGLEGVSVGSHGWTHAHLPSLSGSDLEEELVRPLIWLEERFPGSVVPWLSLPYGRSTSSVVRAAVDAGYERVLDLSGRLTRFGTSDHVVPRVNVPAGVSAEGFLLRTAGL